MVMRLLRRVAGSMRAVGQRRSFPRALPLLGVLALPLFAGTAGCIQKPTIAMHHAEVQGLSVYGINFTIYLQIRNDNAYDIQVRHVNCNVIIGRGYTLGPIDFTPNLWLPSNRTTFLAVPVSIPWQLLPSLIAETVGNYAIPYQVKGAADVTATRAFGIERDNYPIDQAGFVPRDSVVNAARTVMPIPF